jgi:serine/threonine-protein kinase RsbW
MPLASHRTFELQVPAAPDHVGELRHALIGELAASAVPTELLDDVGLAVSEAATNVVLHAYGDDDDGLMDLRACVLDDRVHVIVRDNGRGMMPRPDSPGLGLGLPLITRLADTVEIQSLDGGGTEVRMTFTFASEDAPSRFQNGRVS